MNRRKAIFSIAALSATPLVMNLSELKNITDGFNPSPKMPAVFVGHGSPMNALEDNEFTRGFAGIAKELPQPKAIMVVSAHWLTQGTKVTAMESPPTIHDFGGFPPALYEEEYPAPGSPEFAHEAQKLATRVHIEMDHKWGLDHGTWTVLKHMYPKADIPVFQLSLDYHKPGDYHVSLAQELKKLREKGVLIIGSGNIVHNLRMINWRDMSDVYDWTAAFDEDVKNRILNRDIASLANYTQLGQAASLAIPTPDHYYPLLYTLGVTDKDESISFFNEKCMGGSLSMRSVIIGEA